MQARSKNEPESPPSYRQSNTRWLIKLGTRRLPSTRGTDKGHNTTLELDKRHLTFLIIVSICCRCNYYRSPDNLSATRTSQSVRIFTVRLSLRMHDAGLGLALFRFSLTISVAGVTVPEACQ